MRRPPSGLPGYTTGFAEASDVISFRAKKQPSTDLMTKNQEEIIECFGQKMRRDYAESLEAAQAETHYTVQARRYEREITLDI